MSSESASVLPLKVNPSENDGGAIDVKGGATESVPKGPSGDAVTHSRHSFLDMVTSLEDGAYDISQYCDTVKTRLESIDEDCGSCETAEVQIYLEDVEHEDVTVTSAVSQEHLERERQRRNSAIIVEQVLANAKEGARMPGVPLLLPMVVLSPMDGGFWLEGEGYEMACDESGHWSAQDIATEHISISTDVTPFQFSRYFKNQEHQNYIGKSAQGDPLLISVSLDDRGPYDPIYRVIMRTNSKTWHNEYTAKSFTREPTVWDFISLEREDAGDEDLTVTDLVVVHGPKTSELIQKFDEHMICSRYKFGILYQKFGQKTEGEMFGNEHHSPAMEEFLNLLGDRVKLKGFNRYKAGLDIKENMTGTESLYTEFRGKEIMFHVSTLLPYEPNDRQQIERKRHIGNDVVAIIFQDENTPFCPNCIKSNFLHVFVVVQVEHPNSPDTVYKESLYTVCLLTYIINCMSAQDVAVTGRDVLEPFSPTLPVPPVFMKGAEFRDFLLTKMINAEITARGTSKFKELNLRTRQQLLGQLVKELSSSSGDNDPSGKKRRGRHKFDNATESKVKAKRKPSLNLGNLLLGKPKDGSDEYSLSPRANRRKTTDSVQVVGIKNLRRDSFHDLKTLGNEYPEAEQVKSVTPAEAQKRSVTLPQRPLSIEGDKVPTQKGKPSVRLRTYSHGESAVTTVSPDEGGQQQPVKKKKNIFRRVKNFSTKKKIHQTNPNGDSQVILLGMRAKGEADHIFRSMEDVRMPEFPGKVYSIQKDKHPFIPRDIPDGQYLLEEPAFMPALSQSVPSSPILDRRGSLPALKLHEENAQAAKTRVPVRSYSASRSGHHRVLSVSNTRENHVSPLLKLQQPNPPATSVPGSGLFRLSPSPGMESSQLSLRTQSTNADSFLEADDEASHVAQSFHDSNGHVETHGTEYPSGSVMDDTMELLLRKLEELNSEVACLREENLHLLRRQALMDVTIKRLQLEKVQLERDLAQFSDHSEHPPSRSSSFQYQD